MILHLLVRQSPQGEEMAEASRVGLAGAGEFILLVLGSSVSLVLQSRVGGKEDLPPGTSLRQGPSPGRHSGGGGWCHGEDGAENNSHLFLASRRYSVNPTRAVTVAPRATRSQKDAAPSSTAFKWLQGKREEAGERGAETRPYKHQAPQQPGVLPPQSREVGVSLGDGW